MKKLCILALYILIPYLIAAQQTEYNRKGDEAVMNRDYSDARLYYAEGVTVCDMYSINQLTRLWRDNEWLRTSMNNLMGRCLTCLNSSAKRNDPEAIATLATYYLEGIGTEKDDSVAQYWTGVLDKIESNTVAEQLSSSVLPGREQQSIIIFAGYSFSLLSPVGVTVGGVGNMFGVYGRLRTNASFQSFENEIDDINNISVPENVYLKYEEQTRNTLAISAGLVVKLNKWFYASVGGGYYNNDKIFRYSEWDDGENRISSNKYLKVKKHSYRGIVTELDGMVSIGQIYVAAGFNYNIAGRKGQKNYADLNIGIGMVF